MRHKNRSGRFCIVGLILILVGHVFLAADRAKGMDINVDFKSSSSVFPAYDPDGSRLTALMNAVAIYYEDIFEGDPGHELQIHFYYANLGTGTIADHIPQDVVNGHPAESTIRFNSTWDWFIDDTPFDNSEFGLKQTLYSTGLPSGWFNGDMSTFLEVAYLGSPTATAPPEVETNTDMWSTALHETGHALGMTSTCAGEETDDGDYDFDSSLVWGHEMAANCRVRDDETIDRYHLAAGTTMFYALPPGCRRLPTATDIFSIASVGNWDVDAIDLLRQDFYSTDATADFHTRGNWEGNQVPDSDDAAFIRHSGTVTLSADSSLSGLMMTGNSTLCLAGRQLAISGMTTLGTTPPIKTGTIDIGTGRFDTVGLSVVKKSAILLDGGTLHSSADMTFNSGSFLRGSGTVDADAGFLLAGTLDVHGGNMTINGDLDLESTSICLVELAGENVSLLGSDCLTVNGAADLGSAAFTLSLVEGLKIWPGYVLNVFGWNGTLTGAFATIDTPAGYTFDLSDLYTDGTMTVLTSPTSIPGDANHDNIVDGSDATILANYWQQGNATWEMGDFNGDHFVDGSDATLLASYWQVGIPTPTAVPEPATIALILTALAGWGLFLRRR